MYISLRYTSSFDLFAFSVLSNVNSPATIYLTPLNTPIATGITPRRILKLKA